MIQKWVLWRTACESKGCRIFDIHGSLIIFRFVGLQTMVAAYCEKVVISSVLLTLWIFATGCFWPPLPKFVFSPLILLCVVNPWIHGIRVLQSLHNSTCPNLDSLTFVEPKISLNLHTIKLVSVSEHLMPKLTNAFKFKMYFFVCWKNKQKEKDNSKIQRDRNFVHSVDSPDRLLAKVFESPHLAAALVKRSIGQQ